MSNDNWDFAGVYYDFGKSGLRKKGRTGLERMLRMADKGEINYILTKSVGKVSRNTLELLNIIRFLKERGINMYFENEKLDSLDQVAEAYITLSGAVAQVEYKNEIILLNR